LIFNLIFKVCQKKCGWKDIYTLNNVKNIMVGGLSATELDSIDGLFITYQRCKSPDWDGFDAKPISEAAYNNARLFFEALRTRLDDRGLPLPSFCPIPSGRLGFEWRSPAGDYYRLSIGEDSTVRYEKMIQVSRNGATDGPGTGTYHGTVDIGSKMIPEEILGGIERINEITMDMKLKE
jgi:hypothetical protein